MKIIKFLLVGSVLCFIRGEISETVSKSDEKIQGGENVTDIRKFPYIGYLQIDHTIPNLYGTHCSAILVGPVIAVTAAHCIVDKTGKMINLKFYEVFLVMGVADYTQKWDPSYQRRDIQKLFIHPKATFSLEDFPTNRVNVGAVKWKEQIILGPKVRLAPLVPEELAYIDIFVRILEEGGHCQIPGWGNLEFTNDTQKEVRSTPLLQFTKFDIISKHNCCDWFFAQDYQRCMHKLGLAYTGTLCFVRKKVNTSIAAGDAGSPVVCQLEWNKYVMGVAVAGKLAHDLSPNGPVLVLNPGYFVLMAVVVPFIKEITGEAMLCCNHSAHSSIPALFTVALSLLLNCWRGTAFHDKIL